MASPPPIPPKKQFHAPQQQAVSLSLAVPFAILGVLIIISGLVLLIMYLWGIREIINYSFSPMGGDFAIKYILATHSTPISFLLMLFAGLGLILRWKSAYVVAAGISLFTLMMQFLQIIILGTGGGPSLGGIGYYSTWLFILVVVQVLVFLVTAVLLYTPNGRRHFQASETSLIFGIVLGVLLLADYALCVHILTPWAFS